MTAMSYRKLAEITCKVIRLPEFIPLDWVMLGTESMDEQRELNPDNKEDDNTMFHFLPVRGTMANQAHVFLRRLN